MFWKISMRLVNISVIKMLLDGCPTFSKPKNFYVFKICYHTARCWQLFLARFLIVHIEGIRCNTKTINRPI
jgi:hypothetical protein